MCLRMAPTSHAQASPAWHEDLLKPAEDLFELHEKTQEREKAKAALEALAAPIGASCGRSSHERYCFNTFS